MFDRLFREEWFGLSLDTALEWRPDKIVEEEGSVNKKCET